MTTKSGGTKKPINKELDELKGVQEKLAELEAQADATVQQIRSGFVDCAIVFVDLVGSTKFKIDNAKTPEKWILRVQQFTAVLAQYVTDLGGEVVKYIGDEVMASFTGEGHVNSALNLLLRVEEIQAALTEVTKTPTQVKVAADLGPVYFLKFDEHKALDPQGTPVDRCARIAKHTQPGTVLASFEFSKATMKFITWSKVGTLNLKGLGATSIFKLGEPTFAVVDTEEIPVTELNDLRARLGALTEQVEALSMRESEAVEMNRRLQTQLEEAGREVDDADKVEDSEEDVDDAADKAWKEIDGLLHELIAVIKKAPAPGSEYSRFLFLHSQDSGDTYNKFERVFDKCIEAKLVTRVNENGFYELDTDHRLNKKAIRIMDELKPLLQNYEDLHRDEEDDEELFQYRLSDPAFWETKIGFNVG